MGWEVPGRAPPETWPQLWAGPSLGFPKAACLIYLWEMRVFCVCSLCGETGREAEEGGGPSAGALAPPFCDLCFAAPRGVEGMRLGVCVRRPHHLLSPTGMGTRHSGRALTTPSPYWQ